jgi:hypothetical protein
MSEMKYFLLAFVLMFVATAAHSATPIEPSFNTAICVGNGGSTQGGQVINSYTCSNATSQSFTFTALANGFYTISPNNNSSLCLDAGQGSYTAGSLVEQITCISGQTSQEWQVFLNVDQSYSILTMNGQGILTVAGTYIGAPLTTAQPAGSNTQQFSLPGFGSAPPPVPTVSFSASPTSVISGGSTTFAWSSTNATACTASNGWSGAEATSGTQALNNLTATTTYTLTCTGAGGSANQSVTVTVTAAPLPVPTVSISASPTSVTSGGSATLAWSSTNATACTASNGWSGAEATSGTQAINNLTTTTTYTLTCTGVGGSANQSVTVTVTQSAPAPAGGTSAIEPAFNTSFCVGNSSPNNGQVMTITACGGGTNQSFTFTPVGSYYTIEPVNNPAVCLSFGYGSVTNGAAVQQTTCYANTPQQQWQIVSNSNGTYSILTSTGGGELAASGTYLGAALVTEAPAAATTQEFLLPGFSTKPLAPTVSISASPTSIVSGASSTLTWSSTNVTSCTASGGWSGSEATNGITSVAPTR